MNSFDLKIWDDEADKVTFYTVLREGATKTETDKFFEKFIVEEEQWAYDLHTFILQEMGNTYGAIDEFFNRDEEEVTGLPFKGRVRLGKLVLHYPSFPLRIYALRIVHNPDGPGRDVVVLFNGDKKTAWKNIASGILNTKFHEAKRYAKKITEAIEDGTIIIDELKGKLTMYNGGEEIVL